MLDLPEQNISDVKSRTRNKNIGFASHFNKMYMINMFDIDVFLEVNYPKRWMYFLSLIGYVTKNDFIILKYLS